MTLRAKPVVKRARRSSGDVSGRRNLYMNIAFGLVVIASAALLVGVVGATWYDAHLGAAAKVDGAVITKDQLATRMKIETFRLNYVSDRVRTWKIQGRVTDAEAQQDEQAIQNQLGQVQQVALEQLIDNNIQAKLAAAAGISVTAADADAEITKEATTTEARHAWVIEVTPETTAGASAPTADQTAAAKARADSALSSLKAGKAWTDVAAASSTGTNAAQAGDLGYIGKESSYDQAFLDAIFAATVNAPTDVVLGADGVYRIGRVTEVSPKEVDTTFRQRITDAKITLDEFRAAAQGDVINKKLDDKVVADLSKPSLQRHVEEIYLKAEQTPPASDAVRVRHILFSPNHDPNATGLLKETDPAWQAAKDLADAAYQKLKADPTLFDQMARTLSDESSAKQTGGKQPYYDPTSSIDPAFAAAIFAKGLKPGDILPPVKSQFGWHVIQFMYPAPDADWMKTLKTKADGGVDFAQLARDNSDATDAGSGGDMGFVANGQFGDPKDSTIFAVPIGAVSNPLNVPSDGIYLYKVLGEETRTPTAAQIQTFKDSGFSNWYSAKKSAANIQRLVGTTTTQ
jgi:parvulin-like peptidyl-prolyl isomerase